MADNTMINFGIGLFILGIVGLTLQWNPILDPFPPIIKSINENLGVIQQTSILSIICGLFLMWFGNRKRSS